MKFNLKNRPKSRVLLISPYPSCDDPVRVYETWFEGFEKEVRRMLKKAEIVCFAANGDQIIMLDPKIVKEILGEKEEKQEKMEEEAKP